MQLTEFLLIPSALSAVVLALCVAWQHTKKEW